MKAVLIQETNFNKLKELCKKTKELIIFKSNDDELNRKVIEKLDIDILLIPLSKRKDYQKQTNSGFNQVMAKIAKKKGISLGIDLNEIINTEGLEKANIISRIMQNIKLCKKYKINIKFITNEANKRDIHDLKALGLVLGMPTWMTKNIEEIIV